MAGQAKVHEVAAKLPVKSLPLAQVARDSTPILRENASNEWVFAVVGHIGAGTSMAAKQVVALLRRAKFDVHYIKASDIIRAWADENGCPIAEGLEGKEVVWALQDRGDDMRKERLDAVACRMIELIRESRADKTGASLATGVAVQPDGVRRAYVLDSIRHPAEVALLRHVYGDAFTLIGVVSSEESRRERLGKKLDVGETSANALMKRDASDTPEYGQKVGA